MVERFLILGLILISGCTNEQKDILHSRSFCDFLAMTIFDQVYIYEKGAKEGITESSSYYKLESALQDNLLRALFLVESKKASRENQVQLNHSLIEARKIFKRAPIRIIYFSGQSRQFDDNEPVLPRKIDAYLLFESFFGREAIRDLKQK